MTVPAAAAPTLVPSGAAMSMPSWRRPARTPYLPYRTPLSGQASGGSPPALAVAADIGVGVGGACVVVGVGVVVVVDVDVDGGPGAGAGAFTGGREAGEPTSGAGGTSTSRAAP